MTNQEKLAAIASQLSGIQDRIGKGTNEVIAEIAKLRAAAADADLDFTGLERAVSGLQVGAEALDEIIPDEVEPEETTPEPQPEPGDSGSTPSEPEVPSVPDGEPTPGVPADAEDTDPAAPETAPETPSE